jgi:hypothetical protein
MKNDQSKRLKLKVKKLRDPAKTSKKNEPPIAENSNSDKDLSSDEKSLDDF